MKNKCNIAKKFLVIDKVKEQKIIAINQEDSNKHCFDCGSPNPQYISLYNAIFICHRCMNNYHRIFNSNISHILNNDLYTLSIKDIQYLYYGGNKRLFDFINYEYPILKSINRSKLYITKGLDYYRRCLRFTIDDGEKPLKPSMEECTQLITDMKRNIDSNKYINRKKRNIINIDFINNYYSYEEQDDRNIINSNFHENNYTTNFHAYNYTTNLFNNLNHKRDYSSTYDRNRNNEFRLQNYINTDRYYNNRTISAERQKYNYYKNKEFNRYNQKIIKLKKLKANNNNNNIIERNKLITKRVNLKSKNIFRGKIKNLIMNRNDKNTNMINEVLDNNNIIYAKPKNTLLSSFQRNAPRRKREREVKEDSQALQSSYLIPSGNNYQSILINNNNFDNLLMYSFTDRTHNPNNSAKLNDTHFMQHEKYVNSMNYNNYKNTFDISFTNPNINNTSPNREKIFKKKNLKNSFCISSKKKERKNNINNNTNQSVIENINFQIPSLELDKNLNKSAIAKGDIKLNSERTKNICDIDIVKDNENIKEIKVKKNERFITEENKTSNIANKYSSVKSFQLNDNINRNDKDLSSLKNNITDAKKETNLKKLLTLTRIMKNDMKMSIPELTITDFSIIKEKKSKLNKTERKKEKDVSFDNDKDKDKKESAKIKIRSKKGNTNQTEKNDDYKPFSTLKDIFRLKSK